ncbi:MAG: hypothetical protein RXR20_10060 [Paraburkholderia sp.]|uniref:hypothetical protein n=1 Tax=Burkholderiaceae TaxID=119060 RepID=UPI001485905F|nr:hypothetical protein [Burkholderia sp. 4M9327F10]
MTINITITRRTAPPAAPVRRALPGWVWFIALWCAGVGGAMSLGFAFKVLMNLTLFAVK